MKLGFHHTGVYCRDIEESIAFYESILGCRVLFRTNAMEGDKPLKMAWVKGPAGVFELLESEDKATCDAAKGDNNHIALRVDDMDAFASLLQERGVALEAGPFDPPLAFDRALGEDDGDVFVSYGDAGAQLRILFFRGPGGERFEAVQDNIGAL